MARAIAVDSAGRTLRGEETPLSKADTRETCGALVVRWQAGHATSAHVGAATLPRRYFASSLLLIWTNT